MIKWSDSEYWWNLNKVEKLVEPSPLKTHLHQIQDLRTWEWTDMEG